MRRIKIIAACLTLTLVFVGAVGFVMRGTQDCSDEAFLELGPCASNISLWLAFIFAVLAFISFLLAWILPFVLAKKVPEAIVIAPRD